MLVEKNDEGYCSPSPDVRDCSRWRADVVRREGSPEATEYLGSAYERRFFLGALHWLGVVGLGGFRAFMAERRAVGLGGAATPGLNVRCGTCTAWAALSLRPAPSTSMESVMRRIFRVSMLCLAAGVVNACKPEKNSSPQKIFRRRAFVSERRSRHRAPWISGRSTLSRTPISTMWASRAPRWLLQECPGRRPRPTGSSAPRPRALQRPSRLPSHRRWSLICPPRSWRRESATLKIVGSLPSRDNAGDAGRPGWWMTHQIPAPMLLFA